MADTTPVAEDANASAAELLQRAQADRADQVAKDKARGNQ